MRRVILPALAALLCLSAARVAVAADDLPLAAFFGKFSGGGVAQNRDSLFFGVTARDFDVAIHPAPGNGFRIEWISVIRRGGSPAKPDVRHKSATRTLLPAGAAGTFRCDDSADPLKGGELCWARIRRNTLSMFLLTIDDRGSYELQQYDRTIDGAAMKLVFTSHKDGEAVRTVTGSLVMTGR